MAELGIEGVTDAVKIGSGGSATVYRATQARLGRQVAVKILHVNLGAGNEAERRRFAREQLALGQLSDLPGIVPLYDSGFTDQDRPYLIMPFYASGSLQERIDDGRPIPWAEAVDLMVPVGRAVQGAHEDWVLHRDIKPANIMVGRAGSPKIGDFGIAKLVGSTTMFQSQALSMTPAYAAPEVFSGAEPTVAVDVYGLGATLFALLNGSPAFVTHRDDLNVLALIRRIDSDPVPDLRPLGVPDAVAALVERSMAKLPEDRQPSAAAWADELDAAVGGPDRPTVGSVKQEQDVAATIPSVDPPPDATAATIAVESEADAPEQPLPRSDPPVPVPEQGSVPDPSTTRYVQSPLRQVAAGDRGDTRSVRAPATPVPAPEPAGRPSRRRAGVLVGGISLLAVVALVVGLVVASGGGDGERSEPTATASAPEDEVEAGTPAQADFPTADDPTPGGDDAATDDFGGAPVVVLGPAGDEPSIAGIQAAFDVFNERFNAGAMYVGDPEWVANLDVQIAGGDPPDVSFFPGPGKLQELADSGSVLPLPDHVIATVDEFWAESYQMVGQSRDGVQYGVPVNSDLKSLVWYQPTRFAAGGYEVPVTFADFVELVDRMAADGGPKPLCVGIESGPATGWVYTDWTEELVLRQHGTELYDEWVDHTIPFNDPRIVESMQIVKDLWTEENVFASDGTIATTSFEDNAQPLLDGDCYMHRQGNFFASFFPGGTPFADGSDGAVDAFVFPDINGDRPILTTGNVAAAFQDKPEVWALMDFMATAQYAETRQLAQAEFQGGSISGFLSAARGQDPDVYLPLEQQFLQILVDSNNSRFDASDQMPAAVGFGTFFEVGTAFVNGDIDVQTAADTIEASWPS